jgi:hypothetical protein
MTSNEASGTGQGGRVQEAVVDLTPPPLQAGVWG